MQHMESFVLAACLLLCYALLDNQADLTINGPGDSFLPLSIIPVSDEDLARIVGGRYAENGQFPYQVSLMFMHKHICGGAILSPIYVVTAGHCVSVRHKGRTVFAPAYSLSIRAGSAFIYDGGTVLQVEQVIVHPKFHYFMNDIVLLKLVSSLNFNHEIQPIPLAMESPPSGSPVVVSGWGLLHNLGVLPIQLHYVTLNALSNSECRHYLGEVVTEEILCLAHHNGRGACQGDSGGPAAYNGELVGIAKFVINSCGSDEPDGYTNVTHYAAWIHQKVRGIL